MKQQAFILIGRSGCGKGTQATLLIETLRKADTSRGVRHIETGQEMRRFIQGDAATQKMAKGITESGGLQPEFIATYQWTNVLVNQYNATDHLVFDGSPRKLNEAGTLDSIFAFYGIEKPWIIHLNVDLDEIHNRLLKRGRNDDTRESISRRLAWYETDVAPTVQFYRTNPNYRFLDVNGAGPVEAIHANVVKKLGLS
jgi:adenylate kinase